MKLPLVSVVPGTKLVPAIVTVVAAAPAATEAGVNEVIFGPTTVSTLAAESEVMLFCTVRLRVPGVVMAVDGTVAVMLVAVPAVTVN